MGKYLGIRRFEELKREVIVDRQQDKGGKFDDLMMAFAVENLSAPQKRKMGNKNGLEESNVQESYMIIDEMK